ncbi:hypothetical protein ACFX2H_032984 [Malus domestica]
MEGVINCSLNTHDTEISINCSLNTHDTEIPVQMVDLARLRSTNRLQLGGFRWEVQLLSTSYVMLAQSITDPRTREVLSWKEDNLSFEIKDYKGFDLLMGALFFRHKKWPARFCHYGIKCKFNHPSLQRGQPNCLSQFNMITDKVPARVRERDPPTEKRRWTI